MDKYQTIGARFGAVIIDSFVIVPLIIIYYISYSVFNNSAATVNYLSSILITTLPIIYTVGMHAHYGQTLGKMAAKVKVFDTKENTINLGQSIIRSLPQIIPLFLVIGFQNRNFSKVRRVRQTKW